MWYYNMENEETFFFSDKDGPNCETKYIILLTLSHVETCQSKFKEHAVVCAMELLNCIKYILVFDF